jgi:ferrous iron transport protein A
MMSDSDSFADSHRQRDIGLDELPAHIDARVVRLIKAACLDEQELLLRLLEIGFLPGEQVRVIASGFPRHDPIAVRVGHTTFALRGHEAALVRVTPVEPDAKAAS